MLLPLQGANPNIHIPRALPWAGCLLAFQAVTSQKLYRTPIEFLPSGWYSCNSYAISKGNTPQGFALFVQFVFSKIKRQILSDSNNSHYFFVILHL